MISTFKNLLNMKTSIIKYLSITFLLTVFFMACDDIVTYDDNYDDGTVSNGPPVITRISPVETPEKDTTEGSFNQMIIIHGENLSQVKSILGKSPLVKVCSI